MHIAPSRWRGFIDLCDLCDPEPLPGTLDEEAAYWNRGDPNRPKVISATIGDRAFRACLRVMLEVVGSADFTSGATHYHTRAASPGWAAGHSPCFETAAHLFYNDVR